MKQYSNVVFENIRLSDTPDFVDAYIASAQDAITGLDLSEQELDTLNNNSDLVHELLQSYLY